MRLIFLINFLLAISTTIGMTIIPMIVTESLGLSLFILGMIEGGAEFLSNILRLTTGNLFDRLKNRRFLFVIPISLAFISKFILCFPSSLSIFASKIIERISNGGFSVPRDAYIGAVAKRKGIALGFLSSSKSLGCMVGPILVSVAAMIYGSVNNALFYAAIFACCLTFSCIGLIYFVDCNKDFSLGSKDKFSFDGFKQVLKSITKVFVIAAMFFLARFNDGVIMLYLKFLGFPAWFYLSTIAIFNFAMFLTSPLLGILIDKKKEKLTLYITIIALLLFNLIFYNLSSLSWVFACLGLACWGVQRAGAQIIFPALIFKYAPVKYYGTAIGVYSIISGLGIFVASMIAGYLAQFSYSFVFLISGLFAAYLLTALSLKSVGSNNLNI